MSHLRSVPLTSGHLLDDQTVWIDAFPLTNKHMYVHTKNRNIVSSIAFFRGMDIFLCNLMFETIMKAINCIDDDKVASKALKGDKHAQKVWNNLCDDVALAYCARFVISGVPIPMSTKQPNVPHIVVNRKA